MLRVCALKHDLVEASLFLFEVYAGGKTARLQVRAWAVHKGGCNRIAYCRPPFLVLVKQMEGGRTCEWVEIIILEQE